jgi:hypothetical protein
MMEKATWQTRVCKTSTHKQAKEAMNAAMKVDVNRWTHQQTPNNQDAIRNPLAEGVNATGS